MEDVAAVTPGIISIPWLSPVIRSNGQSATKVFTVRAAMISHGGSKIRTQIINRFNKRGLVAPFTCWKHHMKKKERQPCLYCGKECKRSTTKFCSMTCYGKYRSLHNIRIGGPPRRVLERPCQQCGKVFLPKDYKDNQKFCSMHCAGKARIDFMHELHEQRKGHHFSSEIRANMSLAASKRPARQTYSRGKGGYRTDIELYVRSTWEANIARILKYENILYEYEPDSFRLQNEENIIHYTPDFKLESHYIEVKGWWTEKSKLLRHLMEKQYPTTAIEYISQPEYTKLTEHYKELINEWE